MATTPEETWCCCWMTPSTLLKRTAWRQQALPDPQSMKPPSVRSQRSPSNKPVRSGRASYTTSASLTLTRHSRHGDQMHHLRTFQSRLVPCNVQAPRRQVGERSSLGAAKAMQYLKQSE